MRLGDGGGGEETGIDPSALQTMISTMKSSTGTALNAVDGYIAQFSRFGLETGSLTKAARDLTWAQGQLPMLSRRQSLAQAVANENSGMTWVAAGADSLGNFKTNAAAQQAGQQDAKNFQDGNMSPQDLYAKLAANQGDPAYCTALMKALGADGLRQLEQSDPYDPNDPTGAANRYALAQAVALAMWNGVTFPEPVYDKSTDGNMGREDPAVLAALLQDATFPPQTLADVGTSCLAPGEYEYGNQVWQALADDPAAATLFLHDNISTIPEWMAGNSDHSGGLPDDQAANFAQVIAAGTIGGPGADQNLAAQNTTKLVQYYYNNPDSSTHPEIQAAFGQIVLHYWRDVVYSVTAPAPGAAAKGLSPNGLPLTAGQWAAFIDQAMRNPQTSAALLVTAHAQAKQFQTDSATTGNNYYDFQAGLTSGFFDHQAAQVYATEVSDQAQWRQQVADDTNQVIGVAVDTVFDPGAAVTTIAKPVIEDIASSIADTFINDNLPTSTPQPPVYYGQQDANAYQANIDYASKAVKTLESGQRVAFPVDTVNKYDGGSFVHNGQIDPQNAAELQAYNQWLQDPAVVSYLYGDSQNPQYDIAYQQETGGQSPPPGSTG